MILSLIRESFSFVKEVYAKKYLIFELTKRDFKNRYSGSLLGLFWSFFQPIVMMGILWLAFTYFFKAGNVDPSVPFVCWFFSGIIAWNFFSDGFAQTTGVIGEYSYLVKKMNFRLAILPIVKIISSMLVHFIFIIILIVVLFLAGLYPSLYWLQIFYYLFCLSILLLGLSWLFASLNVFLKDISQMVGILIQFGFWLTPILWNVKIVPQFLHPFLKLNPLFYIIEGYRNTFVYKQFFWQSGWFDTVYFWGFTFVMLFLGIFVFKKLRPHFADVI